MQANTSIKKIFEDKNILVVDKPCGLVVDKDIADFMDSEVDFSLTDKSIKGADEFISRRGVVHRLDKETSGCLVLTKTPQAFLHLKNQFKNRKVTKEYGAVLFGNFPEERVEINAPLGRNPSNSSKFAVVEGGRDAFTAAKKQSQAVIEDMEFSFVSIWPKTGRTHQIRVHMMALGHPVAGDYLYLGNNRFELSKKLFGRMMLHAHKISFKHPITHETVDFAVEYPQMFSIS